MICKQCRQPTKDRPKKLFCCDSCRASFHTELKRLKKKKDKLNNLLFPANEEVKDLYNKIYGKSTK